MSLPWGLLTLRHTLDVMGIHSIYDSLAYLSLILFLKTKNFTQIVNTQIDVQVIVISIQSHNEIPVRIVIS